MEAAKAQQIGEAELANYGLSQIGWKFVWDYSRSRFGQCRYGKREIGISFYLTVLNDENQVRDTILHEIAHALTPGSGHGERWKEMCSRIGAQPQRCYFAHDVERATNYIATCGCGIQFERIKRTRRTLRCARCKQILVWDIKKY